MTLLAVRGMFVQSIKFIESHHGNKREVSIYGQEYTNTTYKLAKMNLAIRGISANLEQKPPILSPTINTKTWKQIILRANPPFNQKDWRAEDELIDWFRVGVATMRHQSNANYGWIQYEVLQWC